MSALRAIFVGLWRAIESPGLVIWLWLVNFAIALPAGVVMSETIRSSIGSSLAHEELATGFDMGWYGEFRQEAAGLERTFTPTVVGAGAFYNNVEGWLFGGLFQQFPGVVGLGVVYALVWALFIGGILDRFSKSEGFFGLSRFLSSGGRFFFRFLRLVVLAGAAYYLVYRFAGWLFRRIDYWARDVTVEGTVLMYVLLGTAVVVFLLTLVNMAFDYAKIATFVEDRSSMILAALRGLPVCPFPSREDVRALLWARRPGDCATRPVLVGGSRSGAVHYDWSRARFRNRSGIFGRQAGRSIGVLRRSVGFVRRGDQSRSVSV